MKKKFIILKKLCAIVTAVCFIFTLVTDNLFASINAEPIQAQKQYFSLYDSATLDTLLSSKYGRVVSFNNNLSDTILINIQDLHCDYFVQKNISSLIEEISKKYKIDNVYVEGGIGDINTSFLANINSEYKQNILDNLLKEGKLTGTEYYSATSGKVDLLKGVENKDIYLKNIVRLDDIINSKEEVSAYLSKINKEIDFLKAKYLNGKNKQFDELLKQSENKIISQENFIIELFNFAKKNNISLKNYENLQIYLSLFDYSINNKKVQKELFNLLGNVKQVLSYDGYNELITLTSKFTDIYALGFFIKDFCKENNINLIKTYPNLAKFLALKEKSLECNPIELVKEERALIDVIRTYLSENQTELEISYLSDFEQFYKGYLSASLTVSQWEYVKLGLSKFKDLYEKYSIENDVAKLEKYSEELTAFYDVNTDRNDIFVKNMSLDKKVVSKNINKNSSISDVLSNAKRIVVLVAGGYHTDGINEILNKKGITNITITPNITNSTQDSRLQYEYLAQQQAMSVKQMIALGLISNATAKEQILAIASSLLKNQNLDGVNINILVQQLNQIFSQDIKVSLIEEDSQLEFAFKDGTKQILSIDEEIANIVEEQHKESLSSGQLVQITGDNLKNIVSLVSATTFNQGTGIFAPQIYQISKSVCLFMVENKWYLGNGAVWEIANSEQNGQTLDGVEPVVYEYMPDFMQKALASKQIGTDLVNKGKKSNKFLAKLGAIILAIALMFNLSGCAIKGGDVVTHYEPYEIETIYLTSQQETFNEKISEILNRHYVGNGAYKSFLYTDRVSALASDKYALMNLENLYDQALAALSYMQIGDVEKASEILHAIDAKDFLSISNLETNTQKTGEIVWVGIAAVQYKLLTGDTSVDNLIKKVDSYLEKNRAQDERGYFYWGGNTGKFVSTEHYFDIIAYFNLKTLLYTDSEVEDAEKNKELLIEAAEFVYNNLYDPETKTLRRGLDDDFQVLDVYAWGVQVLISLGSVNPEIYNNSSLSNIDIYSLLEYANNNFRSEINYKGQKYSNLYRWSNEKDSPISFEWTIELATAYKMTGNITKAEEIMRDVYAYSKALGFDEYIPYSNKDGVYNYYYYGDGWKVWTIPALCTKAQEVQYQYVSFFLPLLRLDYQRNYFVGYGDTERLYFVKYQGSNWRTYSSDETVDILHAKTIEFDLDLLNDVPDARVQIQLLTADPNSRQKWEGTSFGLYNKNYYFDSDGKLKVVIDMGDFLHIENYDANNPPELLNTNLEYIKLIIIAGKTSFFETNLNSNNLDIDVKKVTITYADGSTKIYTLNGSSSFSESRYDVPSSILPTTLNKINKFISKGTFSIRKALFEILNTETVKSLFKPFNFINSHFQTIGAKTLVFITAIMFLASFGLFLSVMPIVVSAVLSAIAVALGTNIGTHVIIDYRYFKSIGLEEAISLYGKDNVRLNENGLSINKGKQNIPIYVINDKPKNAKDFKFKSVPIRVKAQNGKFVKCWIGNYNGVTVLFAEGANYDLIVKEFNKTRQFESVYEKRTAFKTKVDVIEVDMNNPNSGLRYSDTGNIIVGSNIVETGGIVDLQKEISLLNNKKVEAVTINQNIAVYIDDELETISSSQDFVNIINLYVNSDNLGVNAKILFNDDFITGDKGFLKLLEREFGSTDAAKKEFRRIIEQLKRENKEISVILTQSNINKIDNYKEYGIFSYIVDKGSYGCEYIDTISDTKVKANFITNLNQVRADGNLAIIKVSDFKKEISKTSGLFTFLNSSLNIKEILQKKNIEFIKQTANNFDFNQIPNIDIELIAQIIASSENKFEQLSKYLTDTDSISMYYLGLSNDEQRNAFMEEILKRALVVNYLRSFEQDNAYYGLKDKSLENILAKALVEKYKSQRTFEINSNASLNETTAAEVEFELLKKISQLSQQAFEQNDPQSIDDIIKLIPLYAERNVELRTANINIVDIQNIKGILSAA